MSSYDVLLTVGMGRFPFDRLVHAAAPLCAAHRVLAQTGPSSITLPCTQHCWLRYDVFLEHLRDTPVVITHGGNTVRLVQNMGKVPIAVARRASAGEMADDHQVEFLEQERIRGRVVVIDPDPEALSFAVAGHAVASERLLSTRPLPRAIDSTVLIDRMDALVGPLVESARRRGSLWARR